MRPKSFFQGWMLVVVAGCLQGLCSVSAHAGTMYEFKIQSANSTYSSEITLGSGSGGVWSIASVYSQGILSSGGPTQTWSGNASGTFKWNSLANTMSVDYHVQGTHFNMSLSGVSFTGSQPSGLPSGFMLPGYQSVQSPNLVTSSDNITWVTSNIRYFREDTQGGLFGEQDAVPVPGVGALGGLLGFGLLRRQRRRTT